MKRFTPQPTSPAARAALDRARDALREMLCYVAEPGERRVFIGALRAAERGLGVRPADVRIKRG